MKTLKIFMILAFGSFAMNAQDLSSNEVPNEVMTAFENEYSAANDVEWEKSMENFNVEFEIDRVDYDIWYDASGNVVKFEKELMENDLPASIKNALKNDYADFKFEDAELQKENGTTTYRVEVENGNEEKDITFNESGEVIDEQLD